MLSGERRLAHDESFRLGGVVSNGVWTPEAGGDGDRELPRSSRGRGLLGVESCEGDVVWPHGEMRSALLGGVLSRELPADVEGVAANGFWHFVGLQNGVDETWHPGRGGR